MQSGEYASVVGAVDGRAPRASCYANPTAQEELQMKKLSVALLAALAAIALISCANQKAPAEQAVAGATAALAAVHDSAQKYAPEHLQAVEAQVNALKDSLARGDYQGVLSQAPAVMSAINGLKDATAAKQAAAEAAAAKAKDAWAAASAEIPKMIAAISSRIAILSKSHHLPKGVTKASLNTAKAGLDTLKSTWGDATSAAGAADYTTAMAKADVAKGQATQLMHSLGMTSS